MNTTTKHKEESKMEIKETIDYIEERAENISNYSDKLREAVKQIDRATFKHFENAGFHFRDTEIIYSSGDGIWCEKVNYFLAITKAPEWGICVVNDLNEYCSIWDTAKPLEDEKRAVIKNAIKRLPEFLQNYSKYVEEKEREYKEIADVASEFMNVVKKE